MFSTLSFGLFLVIITMSFELKFRSTDKALPVKVHQMSIGKSPLLTEQSVDTDSWTFIGSSLNSNGTIWGRTEEAKVRKLVANCKTRRGLKTQWWEKGERWFTVDVQRRAVLCSSPFVLCNARVVPSVSRLHRFDTQHADPLVRSCYDDAVVGHQTPFNAVGVRVNPKSFNRQISFIDGAHRRHHLVQIYLFSAEVKWNDLRKNLKEKIWVELSFFPILFHVATCFQQVCVVDILLTSTSSIFKYSTSWTA